MDRKKFLFYHLGSSIVVGTIIGIIVFGIWYPAPLATAIGVLSIFTMLIVIDVVIGPLLTFLVYKEGKRSLKFDLSVIISVQIAALFYGVFTISQGRPVWIVFNVDRFDIVQSYEISPEYLLKAKEEFSGHNWFGPKWVAATKSSDNEVNSDLLFESLSGGADLPQRPDLYVPYEQELSSVSMKAIPVDELKKFNSSHDVDRVLRLYPQADSYLPLVSKKQHMVVLIQKNTAEVIAVVALTPW